MRTNKLLSVLACIGLLASGCMNVSQGTKIDPTKVSQIQKGTTTRAELEKLFGPVESTTTTAEGKRTLNWSFMTVQSGSALGTIGSVYGLKTGKMTTRQETLTVTVNKDNIVEDFTFTEGTSSMKH